MRWVAIINELKKQLENELNQWQLKMDDMNNEVKQKSKETRARIQPEFDKAEVALNKAKMELETLDTDTEYAWEKIRKEVKSSFINVRDTICKVRLNINKM